MIRKLILLSLVQFLFISLIAQEASLFNERDWMTWAFAGQKWKVKDSGGLPTAPQDNYFSNSSKNVVVTKSGLLQLKTRWDSQDSTWYSAEVLAAKTFGYGEYIFDMFLTTPNYIEDIDSNIVISVFLYDEFNEKEIDIEFADWGYADEVNNGSWSLHKPNDTIKYEIFHAESNNNNMLRLIIDWTEGEVVFKIFRGDYSTSWELVKETVYDSNYQLGGVPSYDPSWVPNEQDEMIVHMNLWFSPHPSTPYIGGDPTFLTITDFTFIEEPESIFGFGNSKDNVITENEGPHEEFMVVSKIGGEYTLNFIEKGEHDMLLTNVITGEVYSYRINSDVYTIPNMKQGIYVLTVNSDNGQSLKRKLIFK